MMDAADRGIGAKIAAAVILRPAGHQKTGKILIHCLAQIRIMLIIPHQDIVMRRISLDQIGFQNQGFRLAAHNHSIKIRDMLHQSLGFRIMIPTEIRANPVFQVHGLSHIDNASLLVFHQVTARRIRQLIQFITQNVVHDPYP